MEREEENAAFIVVGLIGLFIGYKIGFKSGRQDLLQGLERAQRIIQLAKETQ